MNTSAGLLAPSAFSRSISSSSLPSIRFTLNAGGIGEIAVEPLVGVIVARGIDVDLTFRMSRKSRAGECRDGSDKREHARSR
jgi:hypothetical protein